MSDIDIVVGSGPTGVACARALARRGRPVLVVDAGLTLEPEREATRAALAALPRDQWSGEPMTAVTSASALHGPPVKTLYGSDYPYRALDAEGFTYAEGASVRASNAAGGLSTVWGGAMLPYGARELRGWPIGLADLELYYREVREFVPLAGASDHLAARFPLYGDPDAPLPLSSQGQALALDLERSRARLNRRNVVFGRSRLAVQSRWCVLCGLCLHGCPHQLIYRADATLNALRAEGAVTIRSGLTVQAVAETAQGVTVRAAAADGSPVSLDGARVFLAAGAIGTTAILMRSLGLHGETVRLLDSQYFLAPLLRWRGQAGVRTEALATLCQLFLEIDDPEVSADTVHLQVYGYSNILEGVIRARLGSAWRLAPQATILGRLMLIQGYLHSDHSGRIGLRLDRDGRRVSVTPEPHPSAAERVGRVTAKLLTLAADLKGLVAAPLAEVTEPGRGFHHGGGWPMRRSAGVRSGEERSTDRLGRPGGLTRVHAVDASVFPTIPAPTITLTAMANASQIAAETVRLGDDVP